MTKTAAVLCLVIVLVVTIALTGCPKKTTPTAGGVTPAVQPGAETPGGPGGTPAPGAQVTPGGPGAAGPGAVAGGSGKAGGGGRGGGMSRQSPEQAFAQLDENGDGKISKEEFKDVWSKRLAQAGGKAGKATAGGPPGGGQGKAGGGRPRMDPDQLFARFDTNGDGVVAKDEYMAARAAMQARVRARAGRKGGGAPGGAPPAGGPPAGGGDSGG